MSYTTNETSKATVGPFGEAAIELKRAGLAVLPAVGKEPVKHSFNVWRHAPGMRDVVKWAERNGSDNVVYVAGLSRSKRRPNGIVTVDGDNSDMVELCEKTFGRTPAMVDTRRGKHFLYKAPATSLDFIGGVLRKAGFDIDIKFGQGFFGICVAPPSWHPEDTNFQYRWSPGSGVDALADLPTFGVGGVHSLLDRYPRGPSNPLDNTSFCPPRPPVMEIRRNKQSPRCNSRGLGLNDFLFSRGWAYDNFEDCVDDGRSWNDNHLPKLGFEPLDDDEVYLRALQVWKDVLAGKVVRRVGQRATCTSDGDEVREFFKHRNGEDALALLMLLRAEHGAKIQSNHAFALCIDSMVEARVCGTWAARRYRRARDLLLELRLLEEVAKFTFRPGAPSQRAAQYKLTERRLTPSIEARPKLTTARRIDRVIEAADAHKNANPSSRCPTSAKLVGEGRATR